SLDVGNIETFDAFGSVLQRKGILESLLDRGGRRLEDAKTLLEAVARVRFHQRQHGFFLPSLRRVNFYLAPALFAEILLEKSTILEFHRHVNEIRDIRLVEIYLLDQRRKEFRRIEFTLIFPEEFPAIYDMP